MTTVAAHIVDALADAGVRRIYGVVGDSLNSIVDAVVSRCFAAPAAPGLTRKSWS
jgi:thiamine pyrophosphate-dependent acetolactate synthase large subunit-like protein